MLSACAQKKVQAPSIDIIANKPLTRQKLNSEKMYGYKDVTKELGLEDVEATHIYAVDLNGDYREDLVLLPQFYSTPIFYIYSIEKTKFIRSDREFFPESLKASYLNFADFNNDGIVDVIVAPHGRKTEISSQPLRAFLGEKVDGLIKFREIENAFTLPKATITSSVFLDYDLDGKLDLFNSHWFSLKHDKNVPVPDQLLKWDGKKFLEVSYLLKNEYEYSTETGRYINAKPSFGATVCDIDLNGFPDLLVTSSGGASNKLWLNLYDAKHNDRIFEDYGRESGFAQDEKGQFEGLGGGNSVFSACNDYNNDGIMDLALGEITFKVDGENRDRSSILTGKNPDFPPRFYRTEYTATLEKGSWNQGDRRASWIDLNFDGLEELIVDNSGFPPHSQMVYFEHQLNHSFRDKAFDYGLNIMNPSGTIYFDVNKDGKMDLLVGQTDVRLTGVKKRLFLLLNVIPRKKRRSLTIHLEGQQSNRMGIGSRVILYTDKKGSLKQQLGAYGHQPSQSTQSLYFGLDRDKLLRAVVLWPFAKGQIKANQSPHRVVYDLSRLKFRNHLEIKLCENGKVLTNVLDQCI